MLSLIENSMEHTERFSEAINQLFPEKRGVEDLVEKRSILEKGEARGITVGAKVTVTGFPHQIGEVVGIHDNTNDPHYPPERFPYLVKLNHGTHPRRLHELTVYTEEE